MDESARYHVARKGVRLGEFTLAEVRRGLSSGKFFPEDDVWTEGMMVWAQLADIPAAVEEDDFSAVGGGASGGLPAPTGCPHCQSASIRGARAIYLEETRVYEGSGSSMSWSRSGNLRTYSRKGRYQSKLAQELAPPDSTDSPVGCCLFTTLILGGLVTIFSFVTVSVTGWKIALGLAFSAVVAVAIILWLLGSSGPAKRHKADEQRAQRDYDNTWYCFKCGRTFVWRG